MFSLACAFIANNTGDSGSGEPGAGSSAVLVSSFGDINWGTDIPICPFPNPEWTGAGLSPYRCQWSNASPSLAVFDGKLWIGFIAANGGNNILLCNSADGVNWSSEVDIGQASNGSSPSLAVFENKLWIAFIANNGGKNVCVCNSSNWSVNTDIGQASNGSAPSMAVFEKRLYVGFIAANGGNNILISHSSDGVKWSKIAKDIGQASNGSAPSLATYDNQLWVAFIANNGGNNVCVCNSSNWSVNTDIGQASNGSSPSLTAQGLGTIQGAGGYAGGHLDVGFIANNGGNNILVCSYDGPGSVWSSNTDIGQASLAAPSLAYFDNFKIYTCDLSAHAHGEMATNAL
jgi:hypothetical protein